MLWVWPLQQGQELRSGKQAGTRKRAGLWSFSGDRAPPAGADKVSADSGSSYAVSSAPPGPTLWEPRHTTGGAEVGFTPH